MSNAAPSDLVAMGGSVRAPSDTDELAAYLEYMVTAGASDLFFAVGAVPHVKVEGVMHPLPMGPLAAKRIKELAYSMMSELQMRQFERDLECDLAVGLESVGRFRLNV